jgi:hypothetical protein
LHASLPLLTFKSGPLQADDAANGGSTDAIINDPWRYVMPEADNQPTEWTKALQGTGMLAKIYQVVADGQVLASPGGAASPLLTTLDSAVQSVAGRVWWQAWINKHISDESARLGGGMHNVAYKAPYNGPEFGGDANFLRLFGPQQGLPGAFVIREGNKPTERREVISEFVTTAYGAFTDIGPRVFAMLFWERRDNTNGPEDIGKSQDTGLHVLPAPPPMATKAEFLNADTGDRPSTLKPGKVFMDLLIDKIYYVSEKWAGDCTKIIQPSCSCNTLRVEPQEFCSVFVPLVQRAAAVGVFHGDLKRANLLYRRVGAGNTLELAYTE